MNATRLTAVRRAACYGVYGRAGTRHAFIRVVGADRYPRNRRTCRHHVTQIVDLTGWMAAAEHITERMSNAETS